MKEHVRKALETYATGTGQTYAKVYREWRAMPEADRFRALAAIKELESKHQEWERNGGKLDPVLLGPDGQPVKSGPDAEVIDIDGGDDAA